MLLIITPGLHQNELTSKTAVTWNIFSSVKCKRVNERTDETQAEVYDVYVDDYGIMTMITLTTIIALTRVLITMRMIIVSTSLNKMIITVIKVLLMMIIVIMIVVITILLMMIVVRTILLMMIVITMIIRQ